MFKRKSLIFYCITFMLFCQVAPVWATEKPVNKRDEAISTHCEAIKESLRAVQKNDARARVHLGGRYETILSRFIMPLNVRLVENNLSNADLVEDQNNFATTKTTFVNDYISYQQGLEELVNIDCKNEPSEFYKKLVIVRQKRKTMEQDVLKMRNLISRNMKLVKDVEGKL